MNQSAVRTPRLLARSWRMRAWPSDATVAHLIFVDHRQPPTSDDLDDAIAHALRKGARAIRTSAMFPDTAQVVLAEGFHPIDRLALLQRPLHDHDTGTDDSTDTDSTDTDSTDAGDTDSTDTDTGNADSTDTDEAGRRGRRIGPLRPWHLAECARIDRAAFGLLWGNTPASLRDIRHATPSHHGRLIRAGNAIAGFAISGAAGDTGYLQRLAVAPEHRRIGLARRLAIDSLDWMRGRGVRQAMVNTGVENEAGLALYRSLGFTALPSELTIAELQLG